MNSDFIWNKVQKQSLALFRAEDGYSEKFSLEQVVGLYLIEGQLRRISHLNAWFCNA